MEIPQTYQIKFKVVKKRKDDERRELIDRLAIILPGYTKKGLHFKTILWTPSMLRDAINYCEQYTTIQARKHFFKQYIKLTLDKK